MVRNMAWSRQHLIDGVKEYVDMPFPDKLAISQVIIQRQLGDLAHNVAVAFSGGKDSLVVLSLVRQYYSDVPVLFNNTGVEWPETIRYVRELRKSWDLDLIEARPSRTFWNCVEEYGWPGGSKRGKNLAPCCYWLKEKPFTRAIKDNDWLGYFTGTTAVESYARMFNARDRGTCYRLKHEGVIKINPILWWTPADVWSYIDDQGLAYNSLYDRGAPRIGCMTCTAYKSWREDMARLNPKLYDMILERMTGQPRLFRD